MVWIRLVAFVAGLFFLCKKGNHRTGPAALLFSFFAGINFVLSITNVSLWDVHTARYLFPFFLAVAVGMGMAWQWLAARQGFLAWALLLIVLGGQWSSEAKAWNPSDKLQRNQELINRLTEKGIPGGYADYWIAYLVTAETHEKTILVPTGNDDRYAPYLTYVRTLKEPVLLGQALPAWVRTITLKGTLYQVIGQEIVGGCPITYLRNSAISL
jgi:hypothetical protein